MKINPEKIRDVIGKEGLERVFEVLRAPFTEEPTNWSRRYKANLEKLASGDVIKGSEAQGKYDKAFSDGLDWFQKHYPKENMILLD